MKSMKTARMARRAGTGLRVWMRSASGLTNSWLGALTGATSGGGASPRDVHKRSGDLATTACDSVQEVAEFGRNPGELRMFVYTPPRLPVAKGPLIVVLHGCGQEAALFAVDSGWIGVARRLGLPLVLPEQSRGNNRARCFNWFEPEDIRPGGGEAASIRQMVRVAAKRFGTDTKKVFIVGLSAGGAMAAAMLAAYPSTFSAGAIVAGMPVGVVHGMGGAILRMHHANKFTSRARLAETIRTRAPARRSKVWPRISIWQGERDRVVDPANAAVLAAQFGELHGCDEAPDAVEQISRGISRRVWGTAASPYVELWMIAGMGHGFPIDRTQPGGGRPGPAVLDIGLNGAARIARFFGLER